ncbi:MAG: hypothetical protein Q9221_003312 [Calogaya cf. arnoldii]
MSAAHRIELLQSYRNKAAAHQRAVETAIAIQQEMDGLIELLGGIKVKELLDQPPAHDGQTRHSSLAPSGGATGGGTTGQGVTSNHGDGIKGDCGICMEDLQDMSALSCTLD